MSKGVQSRDPAAISTAPERERVCISDNRVAHAIIDRKPSTTSRRLRHMSRLSLEGVFAGDGRSCRDYSASLSKRGSPDHRVVCRPERAAEMFDQKVDVDWFRRFPEINQADVLRSMFAHPCQPVRKSVLKPNGQRLTADYVRKRPVRYRSIRLSTRRCGSLRSQ